MARKADTPCAGCGTLLWRGSSSLPPGQMMCRPCRMSLPVTNHGVAGYRRGCRCDVCREATNARVREYYRRVGGNKNRKPHHKKSANAPWTEKRRQDAQRRRAQKLGTQTEPIVNTSVYERDGWKCGVCGKRVNSSLTYPHPMSASLDHVIPLSKQGAHTYDNVRLAHLRCNVGRGNRGGNEQLLLIG